MEPSFAEKLAELLNSTSAENGSNTPDFILAEYLRDCLVAFDKASKRREDWYGYHFKPGSGPVKAGSDDIRKMSDIG